MKVDVLTGPQAGRYGGAASLGVRPTFGANPPNLEAFLFDFDGDLYGASPVGRLSSPTCDPRRSSTACPR